ncbi:MAG: 4-amino-4-deoxy-L-arabinose transferase [Ferrovum sp. 37-45-19]|uniref:SMR family transporter n=1 Tax=Ferrovum sp. JA12 TaxID=1356299 RepID=UPI00070252D4|nr:SMR family transporter [Ferrovum sp. JA12]OYV79461.1 MAG: 4-amino-4-deoxy-L-arabinose transferase [Ferrovum sp. 21-44-67]OYV94205.1 MAG: 4-amino-4-deoxy-L-arabinose transferase [Ferrovum sp. 37-45-19]OZB31761.1 MAG: 4-amino-4-deoxy-L-arabinose transferase [Ferrovum sp. 34-44-207]HQT81676.1 SMR family transporter [Ferrovaceae bacterium]KRH78385.1 putative 4-amino-4-deoxy-L-arabinose-phosphoundecaprenol flippase subunit ArnF [Ferrovum sp. JA12]
MNTISFLLILTGVLLNATAQLLLKAGTNAVGHFEFNVNNLWPVGWRLATEIHIIGGLGCYVVSVVVWILALSRVPVSIAYPMLSIGYVVNALIAALWLGESMSLTRVAGIVIIILGVFLIARS